MLHIALLVLVPAQTPADWLAVVERGNGILPETTCARDGPPLTPSQQARFTGPLVLLSQEGSTAVTLGPPRCFVGECGANSMSLPVVGELASPEVSGVLAPAKSIDGLRVVGLSGPAAKASSPPLPPCDAAALGCESHATTASDLAIQVMGAGVAQENGWPHFNAMSMRVLRRARGARAWSAGSWHDLAGLRGTNLPSPVAIAIDAKGGARVYWLMQVGICCPSASSTWTTTVTADGPITTSAAFAGGAGQPCD